MNGVQLPQGQRHFDEAIYFLPLSSQKSLVLILPTSEGWKAELTLEPSSGFEHGTPGLGIQRLDHSDGNIIFKPQDTRLCEIVAPKKKT